ncbi:MAG: rhomboid family intramembrane serine protease [Cytophagales bacterium]|nr:rhomboid family intramembrane serine protease [Cytophagales bacterium]
MKDFVDDFKNVFKKPNNALAQLILINALVFVLLGVLTVFSDWILHNKGWADKVESYIALPAYLPGLLYKPWTLLTYAFVHKGFFHILFNMLVLYWFGQLITNYLGSQKLVNLYVLGALAGALAYIAIYNLVPYYEGALLGGRMIGASAGVFAVVVGAAVLLPNYSFHLLFFGTVRIKYIALVVVLLSFIGITGRNAGGELAHLGGALMGMIYIFQLRKGTDWGKPIAWVGEKVKAVFSRPALKVTHRMDRYSSTYHSPHKSYRDAGNSFNQEEIDAILDKISDKGYDALSREEKQKLFNASKK